MIEFEIFGNKDTRSGFGEGLHELGKSNNEVVALCADLIGSLKMDAFVKDFHTKCPHATIVTSVPSINTSALPILNSAFGLMKIGITGRPKRKYTGPSCSAIAKVACFV